MQDILRLKTLSRTCDARIAGRRLSTFSSLTKC